MALLAAGVATAWYLPGWRVAPIAFLLAVLSTQLGTPRYMALVTAVLVTPLIFGL